MKICTSAKVKGILSAIIIAGVLLTNINSFVFATVTPPSVMESMRVGESLEIEKQVTTPEIPPKIDIMFLFDLSGSFTDDLVNIKTLFNNGLYDDIGASGSDFQLALASFVDYPINPFGYAPDYAFNLDQDFTSDKATWTGAINALITYNGGDLPESQYDALVGASTTGSWRSDAKKVVVIATDAAFHNPDDTAFAGTVFYPGVNDSASTIAALLAEDITVIALKAPGATLQMDDIADATGGSTLSIASDSGDIADAILEGLGNLEITVLADASTCTPLDVSFTPTQQTVTSGEIASFLETITVPDIDPSLEGTIQSCTVVFIDENGGLVGEQTIEIYIDHSPSLSCEPTTNPAGKNIPKAGQKSTGQNEDGFYKIIAEDLEDENSELEIYIAGISDPFSSGDTFKFTERSDNSIPLVKKIGSKKADAVGYHILLPTDPVLTVTDSIGNETTVSCLVPSIPK